MIYIFFHNSQVIIQVLFLIYAHLWGEGGRENLKMLWNINIHQLMHLLKPSSVSLEFLSKFLLSFCGYASDLT